MGILTADWPRLWIGHNAPLLALGLTRPPNRRLERRGRGDPGHHTRAAASGWTLQHPRSTDGMGAPHHRQPGPLRRSRHPLVQHPSAAVHRPVSDPAEPDRACVLGCRRGLLRRRPLRADRLLGRARLWDAETGDAIWTTPVRFWNPATLNTWDLAVSPFLSSCWSMSPPCNGPSKAAGSTCADPTPISGSTTCPASSTTSPWTYPTTRANERRQRPRECGIHVEACMAQRRPMERRNRPSPSLYVSTISK